MDLDETKESLPLDVFMFVVIYSVDLSETRRGIQVLSKSME